MDFIIDWFVKSSIGSVNSIKNIAIIVVPLMLFMEIAKDIKLLDWVSLLFRPLTKLFNTSKQAAFPLAVGFVFGISYGAGVIIKYSEDGELDSKSLFTIAIFLAACHAIVEDTLLFVAIGAQGLIIVAIRVTVAFISTYLISQMLKNY